MSRSKTDRYSKVPGPYRVQVISRRIIDGQTYYTAIHRRTMQVWSRCLPLSIGGGGDASFMQIPIEIPAPDSNEVVEAFLVFDVYGATYLYGATGRPQRTHLTSETLEVDAGEAHPKTFGPGDYVISNGRGESVGRIIVDERGEITLAANTSLRLQVGEGGTVLAVEEGRPSLPVVLYDPLKAYLDDIMARVNANTVQIGLITPTAIAYHETLHAAAVAAELLALAPPAPNYVAAQAFHRVQEQEAAIKSSLEEWAADVSMLEPASSDIGSPTMSAPYKESA